jgi:hypothetical protein
VSGYYESRAVLCDAEHDVEIVVRGGVEADDGDSAYDVTIKSGDGPAVTMRVATRHWRRFVRAVGRL